MLTYVKVLVITSLIGGSTYKQYIFNDYILKDHDYGTEELNQLVDNRYEIVDFNNNIVYAIPLNEEFKVAYKKNPKHQKGGWMLEGKHVGEVEEITKVKCQEYDCLKVLRKVSMDTPFGRDTYIQIQHLLDIRKLPGIGKNRKKYDCI